MKFSKLHTVLVLCAVLVALSVTAPKVSAASLPTLGTRLYYTLGSFLTGGMVSQGTYATDTTSVAGSWQVLPEFASATTLRPVSNATSSSYPYKGTFTAYIRGNTGSTTLRYGAACFPNPLKKVNGGSGTLLFLEYHGGNTQGVGGDIGFVKNCSKHAFNDATASGSSIIDNVCTATGCVSKFGSGSGLNFNNADFIKFTPRANLTAGYTGRITFTLLNDWGK